MNPRLLQLARHAASMTQSETARASGISQAKLSQIEAGNLEPGGELVERIARTLRVPSSFFGIDARPFVHPISYRRRKRVSQRLLRQIESRANIVRHHQLKLLDQCAPDPLFDIPILDVGRYEDGAAGAARTTRAAFQVGQGPIQNVTSVLEDAGILIFRIPFGTSAVDGLSFLGPGEPAFIFVGDHVTAGDRVRHTLAHELGHLVMHSYDRREPKEMESQADEFAGEFLAPAAELGPFLKGLNWTKLGQLKRYWKISMHAIVYRAGALDAVSERTQRRWWQRLAPYRREEPIPIEVEEPTLPRELLDTFTRDLGYSTQQLHQLMNNQLGEYQEIYGRRLGHLRVAK